MKYKLKYGSTEKCASGRLVADEQSRALTAVELQRPVSSPAMSEEVRAHIRAQVISAHDAEVDRLQMLCDVYARKKAKKLEEMNLVADLSSRLSNQDSKADALEIDTSDLTILREAFGECDEKQRASLLPFSALLRQLVSPEQVA